MTEVGRRVLIRLGSDKGAQRSSWDRAPHRLQPISGGTDVNYDKARIRDELRAFASFGTPKTVVRLSRGAMCAACGREIRTGEIEYEIVTNGHEMRLDSDCYLLLEDELATLQPPP